MVGKEGRIDAGMHVGTGVSRLSRARTRLVDMMDDQTGGQKSGT